VPGPAAGRPAVTGQRGRVGELAAAAAQHGLLFGFAAVAAGISARGLTGFARDNMRLAGPWPYLLFFALDGAAGLCAVLAMRRAARGEAALAPRLAVQGLVAASAAFNAAHAPPRPGARAAFALMPVIAAGLFEFSLRETRRAAGRPDRRLAGHWWLRPAERVRVQLQLAADPVLPASAATRHVRASEAARRLYQLRQAQRARDHGGGRRPVPGRRLRRAGRRARAAVARAGFADPAVAAEVLRQVQVLALTPALAGLDYATPDAAHAALGNLISPGPAALDYATPDAAHAALGNLISPGPAAPPAPRRNPGTILNGSRGVTPRPGAAVNGVSRGHRDPAAGLASTPGGAISGPLSRHPEASPAAAGAGDGALAGAAARIVAAAREQGTRLSQAALAGQLRAQGYRIANHRLHRLAAASGLNRARDRA
jgi:hypothetical protein